MKYWRYDVTFNEKSDYFKEKTCENEVKEPNHIHVSAADLLHTV